MLEWLKASWAKWKVRISVVGGVLVIATAYGTCSVDPQAVSEVEVEPDTTPLVEVATTTTDETTTNVEEGTVDVATTTETTTATE
jgi:hypothetical protein